MSIIKELNNKYKVSAAIDTNTIKKIKTLLRWIDTDAKKEAVKGLAAEIEEALD